ncbi:MAG: TadE family protein [Thermaerobacterales bacterium]
MRMATLPQIDFKLSLRPHKRPMSVRLPWRERGQATVELALLLPILLMLVLAIVEFGFLFSAYQAVQHGAREGARIGIVNPGDDQLIEDRVSAVTTQLNQGWVTVTVTPAVADRRAGDPLTVQVRYIYHSIVPLIGMMFGQEMALESVVSMRME